MSKDEQVFKTQQAAVNFLRENGYKVSSSTFNNDFKAGLVPRAPDKNFLSSELLAYAEHRWGELKTDNGIKIFRKQKDACDFLQEKGYHVTITKFNADFKNGLIPCTKDKYFLENDLLEYAEKRLKASAQGKFPSQLQDICPESMADGRIAQSESEVEFFVQGSAAEPYHVTFLGAGEKLTASCTCPAGRKRCFCKHVAGLLAGDATKITQGADRLAELAIKAQGSPLLGRSAEHLSRQAVQQPLGFASLEGLVPMIEPMLAGTCCWVEFYKNEEGYEQVSVCTRKMRKDGKPFKHPTRLLEISYNSHSGYSVYDEQTDTWQVVQSEHPRPYRVKDISYGKIESAWAVFKKELEQILAEHGKQST